MKNIRLFLAALLCLALASGWRERGSEIPEGFEPPRLFIVDSEVRLTVDQHAEMYRLGRILLPEWDGSAFVLKCGPDDLGEMNVAREYYDYMIELLGIYNGWLAELPAEQRDGVIASTKTWQRHWEGGIVEQYLRFDEDKNPVTDLTIEISRRIGLPDSEYQHAVKQVESIKAYLDVHRAQGTLIDEYIDAVVLAPKRSIIFLNTTVCDERMCWEDPVIWERIDELNSRYI